MLRISKGKETLTLKGDHLETNFQGFYQKSLHWRPRSPMETSVHNPATAITYNADMEHFNNKVKMKQVTNLRAILGPNNLKSPHCSYLRKEIITIKNTEACSL